MELIPLPVAVAQTPDPVTTTGACRRETHAGACTSGTSPGAWVVARRNRAQRGITVFVVMTATMLLTAAGVLAMHFSGLAVQASGYSRAAAQTLYAAELGLLSTSAYMAMPGNAEVNFMAAQNAVTRDACLSAPDTTAFCKNIGMSNLDETISARSLDFGGTAYTLLDQMAAGSMGPFAASHAAGLQGDFFVEMTDPRPAAIPGEDTDGGQYQQVTLTSFGVVRPGAGGAAICAGASANNAAATLLGARAHMIIGPVTHH